MKFLRDTFVILWISITLLFALEGALRAWHSFRNDNHKKSDPRMQSKVYDNYPEWREDLAREHVDRKVTQKFYSACDIWMRGEFSGKTINVDSNGVRKTCYYENPENGKAKKVFMFGGSTMWGNGVPDCSTLPSFVARYLNADQNQKWQIYNFGQAGYVFMQELIKLEKLLIKNQIPDIVVFYDGVNDSYVGAYSPGDPYVHGGYDEVYRLWEIEKSDFQLLKHLLERSHIARTINESILPRFREGRVDTWDSRLNDYVIKARVERTVQAYTQKALIAKALAESFGFEVLFFWQPVLAAERKPLSMDEQRLINGMGKSYGIVARKLMYAKARNLIGRLPGFIYMADIFQEISETLYIDSIHLSPQANQIVGKFISNKIRETTNLE